MVKLRDISKKDNEIVCNAFVEDCSTPIRLVLDIKSKELAGYEFPRDYEWCKTHVMYAKRFLISLISKDVIPSEKVIMWY